METIQLTYASRAVPLRYADLTALLIGAEAFNRAHAISGMLVYGNDMFLQVLEGDRVAVNAAYARILKDSRHSRCTLLSVEVVAERLYGDWGMKLVGLDEKSTVTRRELLERVSGQGEFDPFALTAQRASLFLRSLAVTERQLAA